MSTKHKVIVTIVSIWVLTTFAGAATPPDAINYQGVLRDAAGAPLDGDFDMVFRFYDAAAGGGAILSDAHVTAGTGAVNVSDGLFNVALGTGEVTDGSGVFPGDPYTSLIPVFRDFTDVWVEIQIGQEVLAPRVKVISAGHALNADNAELLDGLNGSQLLRSDQDASSSGTLTAAELKSNGAVFVNADGPDGSQSLFFYDEGMADRRSLRWNDVKGWFELNGGLNVDDLSSGGEVRAADSVYVNANGIEVDSTVFFYDDGDTAGQSFRWDESATEFLTSADLTVTGDVTATGSLVARDRLYLNADGPDGPTSIYFYDGGTALGESLFWIDAENQFTLSNQITVRGEVRTEASQIVIKNDGPNGNQDIEFFHDFAQFERFQWDDAAERFEVSDDFHAFGDLSTSGAKPFVQNHPYRDDLEIVYTAIEGNEVTTFTRGSGRLVGGEARIELEESFRYVTNPDLGLTAHLTPRGEWTELFVASISTTELVVRSVAGDDVAFDYVVYGLRVGYEDYPVYRPKRAESFAPPKGAFAEDFVDEPALADHTALARYKAMNATAFGKSVGEMTGALALREAIGMREPDRDYPRGSELSVGEMNRIALESGSDGGDGDGSIGAAYGPSDDAGAGTTGTSGSETTTLSASVLQRDADGNVYARSFRPSAGDIASLVAVSEPVEAGDVLVIDPEAAGHMALGRHAGDTAVFGVVAAEPGVVLGAAGPESSDESNADVPVAVSGVVLCKVDAGWGAIRPGDLLQTSPTPGHAMRADDPQIGGVLGKALEPLDAGTGTIRVLVTLR